MNQNKRNYYRELFRQVKMDNERTGNNRMPFHWSVRIMSMYVFYKNTGKFKVMPYTKVEF